MVETVEQSAVWETLLVMERFNYRAQEEDTGAITLVLIKAQSL